MRNEGIIRSEKGILQQIQNGCDDVMNFTRTLSTAYMYGNYRHAHSAHQIHLQDLESRVKLLECFSEI